MDRIREVKRAHEAAWLEEEDVVAVGVGRLSDGRPGIVVSLRTGRGEARERIPEEVEEVRVECRVVGDVRAW